MKITAIVLAAGSGSRMKSKTKKQFMSIDNKPMLYYSLCAFEKSKVDSIVLVTSKEDVNYVKEMVKDFGFSKIEHIVEGGAERYNSVMNGLSYVDGDIVLVHDGARPLINQTIIDNCIAGANEHGACVAGVPAKDTIKLVDQNLVIEDTPNRSRLYITQTPQAFGVDILKRAYEEMEKSGDTDITDDAMVVERYTGANVRFVEGDYKNIKVTTPEDIQIAELFLKQ